jgi:hypothetical protein
MQLHKTQQLIESFHIYHRSGLPRVTPMMTTNASCRKYHLVRIAWTLLFWAAVHSASAQVIPPLRQPPNIQIFTTFTVAKPDYRYYYDFAVNGFSAGGFWQTRHVVGAEVRGSIIRWGGDEHEEAALAGPRAALHFGRVSPYTAVLFGGGNAWSRSTPPANKLTEGLGLQWSVLGGVDIHLTHHINFRAGELSYSKIYLPQKTLSPLNASVGIVYRIF